MRDKLAHYAEAKERAGFQTELAESGKSDLAEDAVEALVGLGEAPTAARQRVRDAIKNLGDNATIEDIIRACLKK